MGIYFLMLLGYYKRVYLLYTFQANLKEGFPYVLYKKNNR